MEIRELTAADKNAFLDYAADWENDDSPFSIVTTAGYPTLTADNFSDWLTAEKKAETLPANPDWSTQTNYYAVTDDGQIAGIISCRWQIEKGNLLAWAGHIGYAVAPSFRGERIAEEMLAFALTEYVKRGILHVLISANEKNIASRKTIEHCGGQLENIVEVDGKRHCRYWIERENEN